MKASMTMQIYLLMGAGPENHKLALGFTKLVLGFSKLPLGFTKLPLWFIKLLHTLMLHTAECMWTMKQERIVSDR